MRNHVEAFAVLSRCMHALMRPPTFSNPFSISAGPNARAFDSQACNICRPDNNIEFRRCPSVGSEAVMSGAGHFGRFLFVSQC